VLRYPRLLTLIYLMPTLVYIQCPQSRSQQLKFTNPPSYSQIKNNLSKASEGAFLYNENS